jgi:hypothetical protein
MKTWKHENKETWRPGNMEKWRHGNMEMETKSNGKWKTEAQAKFLNPFTVGSSCKRKFVVFPFIDLETSGSYPFKNGLNVLNVL